MADKKIPLQQASCLVRRLEGVADLRRLEGDHDEADVIDEAVVILKANQPAAPVQPSFKEWTQDYVRDNIHKLKVTPPAQPAPVQDPMQHYITPLMEQQMFDDWCPYKGNPDPRTVWSAAIDSVNGLLLAASATPPAAPVKTIPLLSDPKKELRQDENDLWCIYLDGRFIRWLNMFERNFVDSAIAAAHGITKGN